MNTKTDLVYHRHPSRFSFGFWYHVDLETAFPPPPHCCTQNACGDAGRRL